MSKQAKKLEDYQTMSETAEAKPKIIGHIVWWHIEGDHPRPMIEAACQAAGIKPTAKRAQASFTNAVKAMEAEHSDITARVVANDFTKRVVVLADVKSNAAERKIEVGNQSWVAFSKVDEQVHWKEGDERTKEFSERFQWFQDHYTNQDVRSMFEREIKDTGAVSLRRTGGIYFIAPDKEARIKTLHNFLLSLGNGSHVSMVGIPSADIFARDSIKKDYIQGGQTTLENIMARLEETTSMAGKAKLLRELVEIEEEATNMEALLDFKADALRDEIKKVRGLIRDAAKGS